MTLNEQQDIEERIRALDDQALLRLVAIEASKYQQRPESLEVGLEIAHDELRRRHIDVLNAEQYYRRFPKERWSWKKTARKVAIDGLWAAAAVGGLMLPFAYLCIAVDKEWISQEKQDRIIRIGVIAFFLVIVLPAIRKARIIDPLKKDLLGKEVVIGCVAFGVVAFLALVAYVARTP